jgi:hypothetical protein
MIIFTPLKYAVVEASSGFPSRAEPVAVNVLPMNRIRIPNFAKTLTIFTSYWANRLYPVLADGRRWRQTIPNLHLVIYSSGWFRYRTFGDFGV